MNFVTTSRNISISLMALKNKPNFRILQGLWCLILSNKQIPGPKAGPCPAAAALPRARLQDLRPSAPEIPQPEAGGEEPQCPLSHSEHPPPLLPPQTIFIYREVAERKGWGGSTDQKISESYPSSGHCQVAQLELHAAAQLHLKRSHRRCCL